MIDFLNEIKRKDKRSVKLIYERYGKKLYGYAVAKWKLDEDDAWDLVYTTLYKTIEVTDRYTFETESKFTGFLFTVFTNNLRNFYQKKKKTEITMLEIQDRDGKELMPEEEPERKESIHMKCLQQGLHEMEDWKRVVLLMRAQEFSYEEIAAYVQRPADQLKVYYMRLKKLIIEKVNECVGKTTDGKK